MHAIVLAIFAAVTTLQSAVQKDLDSYLASRAKIEHISAISLSVSLHGNPVNMNWTAGRTSFGGSQPVTPENLYQIGSNTKAFTAVTLLQLEAAGALDIDQTVGKFLPQYPAWRDVSIRHLLDMTTGIPEYLGVTELDHITAVNPQHDWSAAALISYVYPKSDKPIAPFHGWQYSNTNYLLSQLIIEKVTGHSYADEIESRFLGPKLGLSDTYYSADTYPASVTDRMVSGYFFNTDPGNEELAPLLGTDTRLNSVSWAQGAGGIVSRPIDLTKWARALYVGDLLAPKQRRELESIVSLRSGKTIPTTSLADPLAFGLGVAQFTKPGIGTAWYYEGETLGYRMVYAYFPKYDDVIAVGLNSQPSGKQDHVGELVTSVFMSLQKAGKL